MFTPRRSRADYLFIYYFFFGGGGGGGGGEEEVSNNNCCHGNTLNIFWVLTFVCVPQPKPMHGFSPNFLKTVKWNRIYRWVGLGVYLTTPVAIATLSILFGLKLLNWKRGAIKPMLPQLHFNLPQAKAGDGRLWNAFSASICVCVHACVRLSHF